MFPFMLLPLACEPSPVHVLSRTCLASEFPSVVEAIFLTIPRVVSLESYNVVEILSVQSY